MIQPRHDTRFQLSRHRLTAVGWSDLVMVGRRVGVAVGLVVLAGCATQPPARIAKAPSRSTVDTVHRAPRYSLPTKPVPAWGELASPSQALRSEPDPEKILSGEWTEQADKDDSGGADLAELAAYALNYLGVPYRMGGSSPEAGFDCSGLVHYVSREVLGLKLPRRAEDISRVGAPIDIRELQPGDLVFYNTLRRKFSHVGIYLGEGRFVHSPSAGGVVRIEKMDIAYWKKRFNGARRLASAESASR